MNAELFSQHHLPTLQNLLGACAVFTNESDKAPYLQEWRKRVTGKALAVIQPQSTQQVSEVVHYCSQHRLPLVPQGGNTGLVLGSIPAHENSLILSTKKLNRIREIDTINRTITVESGCTLYEVQQAAREHHLYFPLSLASEGSCTIGGNLSSNAGGTAVLRYGTMRDLCLGLEVVTAQGEIWHGLQGCRKDNTGYDLKSLFIGAEGTLGLITATTLKLYSLPQQQLVSLLSFRDFNQALDFFLHCQTQLQEFMTAFEIMNGLSIQLVQKHYPHYVSGLSLSALKTCGSSSEQSPYFALIEVSSSHPHINLDESFIHHLQRAMDEQRVKDVVIAQSEQQAAQIWRLRESISEAQSQEGLNIKHDISIPLSQMPHFVADTEQVLQQNFTGCRLVNFGHMGDGNLHFNISSPSTKNAAEFLEHQVAIHALVYEKVHQYQGSISAEHGIGGLKIKELATFKSPTALAMMKSIKKALDPHHIFNPHKIWE